MTTLDYSDIPLGPNEIRLVSLEGCAEDVAQANWKIKVANLADESTSYYAVSYRWGAPLLEGRFKAMTNEPVSPIQFNNSIVKVTENLSGFLDQVEVDEKLKENEFWIDAICINQNDPEERSHQVSTMMAKIYRSATRVIAWLGDEDLHTQQAFDHLSKLATFTTLPTLGTQSPSTNHTASADVSNDRSSWESTAKLFERTYWNRSWIIQELVLPQNVTVHCGRYSIDWSVLFNASHNISTGIWREFFNRRATGRGSLKTGAGEVCIPPRNYSIPAILKATKETMATEHWTNVLLHTLIRSRDFKATNLEDKVYALMGLIKDSVDIGKMPLLRPEFGKDRSAAQTYLKAAIQLLRDCEELLILSCVEGRSFQKAKINVHILPSWVPDWSETSPLGLRVTGYKRYCADACFFPSDIHLSREEKLSRWPAVVNEEDLTVVISGLKVDEISFRGEPKHDIQEGKPFPCLLNMLLSLPTQYQPTQEDRWEVCWRTLIANTAGKERLAPPKSSFLGTGFAKWFLERIASVSTSRGEDCQWNELKQRFDKSCRGDKGWTNLATAYGAAPAPTLLSSTVADYGSLFSHAKHLRPFITEKGYLGLGSENLQEGDTIWVVPRSRVPLIFRRVRDAGSVADYHCELVGGAYLHGFMDGRTVLAATAKEGVRLNDALKTIIIH